MKGPTLPGASVARPLKSAAACVRNATASPRFCSRFLDWAGVSLPRVCPRWVKSVQKCPVSRPFAADAVDTGAGEELEPAGAEGPAELPVGGAEPPMEPPPQPPSIRQAPATAATIAETRGVDLMASMSCPSW